MTFPTWQAATRFALTGLAFAALSSGAFAQKKYDTGADDKEIKIGNIMPYSGPASAYGVIGKAMQAYWDMVNAQGGVNGRKIKFISVDDGYNPAKTVEQARKLVEEEEVLLLFAPLGTPPNSAIHKYMNQKKVPQLFVATGATKWGDPKNFPWTMGWQPPYTGEGKIYAQHLLETMPNAKIAILFQTTTTVRTTSRASRTAWARRAARRSSPRSATRSPTPPSTASWSR